MPSTEHWIEHAKSGRSKCKRCKELIENKSLRIVADAYSETMDRHFTSSYHVSCFKVPPQRFKGMSPEDFVEEHLEDKTSDEVLSDDTQLARVIADIAITTNGGSTKKTKAPKKKRGGDESSPADTKAAKKVKNEPEVVESPLSFEWVGCDKCEKWRKLPFGIDPAALPDTWDCTLNDWDGFNTCDVLEEEGASD